MKLHDDLFRVCRPKWLLKNIINCGTRASRFIRPRVNNELRFIKWTLCVYVCLCLRACARARVSVFV